MFKYMNINSNIKTSSPQKVNGYIKTTKIFFGICATKFCNFTV